MPIAAPRPGAFALLGLLLVLALAGCRSDPTACTQQSDCFGAEACVEGSCVAVVVVEDTRVSEPDVAPDLPPDMPPDLGPSYDGPDCRINLGTCDDRVCNTATGVCIDCEFDLHCGSNGLCELGTGRCACAPGFHRCQGACVADDDPAFCGTSCIDCTSEPLASPTCTGGVCGLVCDAGAVPCDGPDCTDTCVECNEAADCTDPSLAACVAHSCEPCVGSGQCSHLPDAKVCVVGRCVECTAANESACAGTSCNPATNACTTTLLASARWCEHCVADSECQFDQRCIQMNYRGTARPDGYCLSIGSNCNKPTRFPVTRTSLSGVPNVTYCAINENVTTCEAIKDFGQPCMRDPECGHPQTSDGLCRSFSGIFSCTSTCTISDDCPGGGFCASEFCLAQ